MLLCFGKTTCGPHVLMTGSRAYIRQSFLQVLSYLQARTRMTNVKMDLRNDKFEKQNGAW